MATFTEELAKLAAEALYEREHTEQEERSRLRAHLARQWKVLRNAVVGAAKNGCTTFKGTLTTNACQFSVFSPKVCHVEAALPDELKAMNESDESSLSIFYDRGAGTHAPSFTLMIQFHDSAAKSLAKLKRDRAAAEGKDGGGDAAAKRVKAEQTAKVKVEKRE